MSLEQVKSDILNEAEQKSNQIVSEAEEEAEQIVSDAEEERDRIQQEAEEEIEARKESIRKKALSNARMKARQLKLREKQEHLDDTFRQFREELEDMEEDERKTFIESCLERAEFEVGKVRGSEEFEDVADTDFEQEDIDGIVLESEDGERRMDFTFDRIVESYRENLRKEVSEVLFK